MIKFNNVEVAKSPNASDIYKDYGDKEPRLDFYFSLIERDIKFFDKRLKTFNGVKIDYDKYSNFNTLGDEYLIFLVGGWNDSFFVSPRTYIGDVNGITEFYKSFYERFHSQSRIKTDSVRAEREKRFKNFEEDILINRTNYRASQVIDMQLYEPVTGVFSGFQYLYYVGKVKESNYGFIEKYKKRLFWANDIERDNVSDLELLQEKSYNILAHDKDSFEYFKHSAYMYYARALADAQQRVKEGIKKSKKLQKYSEDKILKQKEKLYKGRVILHGTYLEEQYRNIIFLNEDRQKAFSDLTKERDFILKELLPELQDILLSDQDISLFFHNQKSFSDPGVKEYLLGRIKEIEEHIPESLAYGGLVPMELNESNKTGVYAIISNNKNIIVPDIVFVSDPIAALQNFNTYLLDRYNNFLSNKEYKDIVKIVNYVVGQIKESIADKFWKGHIGVDFESKKPAYRLFFNTKTKKKEELYLVYLGSVSQIGLKDFFNENSDLELYNIKGDYTIKNSIDIKYLKPYNDEKIESIFHGKDEGEKYTIWNNTRKAYNFTIDKKGIGTSGVYQSLLKQELDNINKIWKDSHKDKKTNMEDSKSKIEKIESGEDSGVKEIMSVDPVKEEPGEEETNEPGQSEFEFTSITKTKHTKNNTDLWVVQFAKRESREVFIKALSRAKKLGGYYSKYAKQGAIPGFTFKNEEAAKSFVSGQGITSEQAQGYRKNGDSPGNVYSSVKLGFMQHLNAYAFYEEKKQDLAKLLDRFGSSTNEGGLMDLPTEHYHMNNFYNLNDIKVDGDTIIGGKDYKAELKVGYNEKMKIVCVMYFGAVVTHRMGNKMNIDQRLTRLFFKNSGKKIGAEEFLFEVHDTYGADKYEPGLIKGLRSYEAGDKFFNTFFKPIQLSTRLFVPKKNRSPHYDFLKKDWKPRADILLREIMLGKMEFARKTYFDSYQDMGSLIKDSERKWTRVEKLTDIPDLFEKQERSTRIYVDRQNDEFNWGYSSGNYDLRYRRDYKPKAYLDLEDISGTRRKIKDGKSLKEQGELYLKHAASIRKNVDKKREQLKGARRHTKRYNDMYLHKSIEADMMSDKADIFEAVGNAMITGDIKDYQYLDNLFIDVKPKKVNLYLFVRGKNMLTAYTPSRASEPPFVEMETYQDSIKQKSAKEIGLQAFSEVKLAYNELQQIVKIEENQEEKIQREIDDLVNKARFSTNKGFFPTPPDLISAMLKEANIEEKDVILEPSAGVGHLADAIKERYPNNKIDVVEVSPGFAEILNKKGYNVVGSDILSYTGKKYDKVLMNPPFQKLADVDHIMHVYDNLLKPGGMIVAITSESPFFQSQKKAQKFRDFVEEFGFSVQNPKDSFKGIESFKQTGVNTRLVVLEKPGVSVEEKKKPSIAYDPKEILKKRKEFEFFNFSEFETFYQLDRYEQKEKDSKEKTGKLIENNLIIIGTLPGADIGYINKDQKRAAVYMLKPLPGNKEIEEKNYINGLVLSSTHNSVDDALTELRMKGMIDTNQINDKGGIRTLDSSKIEETFNVSKANLPIKNKYIKDLVARGWVDIIVYKRDLTGLQGNFDKKTQYVAAFDDKYWRKIRKDNGINLTDIIGYFETKEKAVEFLQSAGYIKEDKKKAKKSTPLQVSYKKEKDKTGLVLEHDPKQRIELPVDEVVFQYPITFEKQKTGKELFLVVVADEYKITSGNLSDGLNNLVYRTFIFSKKDNKAIEEVKHNFKLYEDSTPRDLQRVYDSIFDAIQGFVKRGYLPLSKFGVKPVKEGVRVIKESEQLFVANVSKEFIANDKGAYFDASKDYVLVTWKRSIIPVKNRDFSVNGYVTAFAEKTSPNQKDFQVVKIFDFNRLPLAALERAEIEEVITEKELKRFKKGVNDFSYDITKKGYHSNALMHKSKDYEPFFTSSDIESLKNKYKDVLQENPGVSQDLFVKYIELMSFAYEFRVLNKKLIENKNIGFYQKQFLGSAIYNEIKYHKDVLGENVSTLIDYIKLIQERNKNIEIHLFTDGHDIWKIHKDPGTKVKESKKDDIEIAFFSYDIGEITRKYWEILSEGFNIDFDKVQLDPKTNVQVDSKAIAYKAYQHLYRSKDNNKKEVQAIVYDVNTIVNYSEDLAYYGFSTLSSIWDLGGRQVSFYLDKKSRYLKEKVDLFKEKYKDFSLSEKKDKSKYNPQQLIIIAKAKSEARKRYLELLKKKY